MRTRTAHATHDSQQRRRPGPVAHPIAPAATQVASKVFGSAAGLVDMLVQHVPSSKAGTASKVARLYTGPHDPASPLFHFMTSCSRTGEGLCWLRARRWALLAAVCVRAIQQRHKLHPSTLASMHCCRCRRVHADGWRAHRLSTPALPHCLPARPAGAARRQAAAQA